MIRRIDWPIISLASYPKGDRHRALAMGQRPAVGPIEPP
jgi:hypothetical protein